MLMKRLESDFKNAMKEKNELVLGALRMLKAAIKNKEIEKRGQQLLEEEVLEIIQKQIKQHKDSIADFEKAKREDLLKKEKAELVLLEGYLPEQLSEEELKTIAQNVIQAVGAKSKAEMGKVMKEIMPQVTGRADGKRISQLVQSLLP